MSTTTITTTTTTTTTTMCFRLLLTLVVCLSVTNGAGIPRMIEEHIVVPPFKGCHQFKLGGSKGIAQTYAESLKNGSMLAFYPLLDDETMLNLNILLKDTTYNIMIEASMVTLEKCDVYLRDCKNEGSDSAKYSDYIKPHMWNQVFVTFANRELQIHVGQRMVKSMSMVNYEDLEDAYWKVVVPAKKQRGGLQQGLQHKLLYLVQFNCKDPEDEEYHRTTPKYPMRYEPDTDRDDDEEYHTNAPGVHVHPEPGSVFEGCEQFKLGGTNGAMETSQEDFQNGSMLALYPMKSDDTMLNFVIILEDAIFNVEIESSMVTLEKCNAYFKECKQEALDSVKHSDYIKPHKWNQVYVILSDQELKIHIGQRMVKSMSMVKHDHLESASWKVVVHPRRQISRDVVQHDYLYLVQFNCKDEDYRKYQTTTTDGNFGTPERHIELTTVVAPTPAGRKGGQNLVGLVVGLIVGLVILVALVIVVYNVVQKRRSANITTETTALQQPTK